MSRDSTPAQLRRGVTMRDLDRAARRFSADVDAMLARSDRCSQPLIAAMALITLGGHMDRRTLELALAGSKDISTAPAQQRKLKPPA
jgi:hypothetical protein